jgi:aspartokinase-like uncharacterized kinase
MVAERRERDMSDAGTVPGGVVTAVVKIGGSLLHDPASLHQVLDAVADARQESALLVVPGGGPFADAVRAMDRHLGLTDDAAHWMAVLAMDQYAHLLQSRLRGATLVSTPAAALAALDTGALPVLAPYRWLRDADPLPHSWDVTSDSIAAWIAGELGAPRLVLIKPAGVTGEEALDAYFPHACRRGTSYSLLPADRAHALRPLLRGAGEPAPLR